MENSKEKAIEFVKNGGKSVYRYVYAFKGAGSRPITQEDALSKLSKPAWDFGIGFYSLGWLKDNNGEVVLEFNELSENDMW